MPHKELEALFDAAASLEEAQAIASELAAERQALANLHPNAKVPGSPTFAVLGSLATASVGVGKVAQREAVLAQEAGEEARTQHLLLEWAQTAQKINELQQQEFARVA